MLYTALHYYVGFSQIRLHITMHVLLAYKQIVSLHKNMAPISTSVVIKLFNQPIKT